MEKQIEIKMAHEKSYIELLLGKMSFGCYGASLDAKLGKEEASKLRNSIKNAALLDADNIRKEAQVAVVKLSAALETTTRLLEDTQKRLEEAEQMVADLSRKTPEA
jgi:hypothetical protein